jgi:circadian clock protein KaiB
MKKKTAPPVSSKKPARVKTERPKTLRGKARRPTSVDVDRDERRETWNMRLYVAGQSARSIAAIANLRRICDQYLVGRHSIEVIDLTRHPEMARIDQIVAIPTLIRKMPSPIRRIIGDLSLTEKVVVNLDLATT